MDNIKDWLGVIVVTLSSGGAIVLWLLKYKVKEKKVDDIGNLNSVWVLAKDLSVELKKSNDENFKLKKKIQDLEAELYNLKKNHGGLH